MTSNISSVAWLSRVKALWTLLHSNYARRVLGTNDITNEPLCTSMSIVATAQVVGLQRNEGRIWQFLWKTIIARVHTQSLKSHCKYLQLQEVWSLIFPVDCGEYTIPRVRLNCNVILRQASQILLPGICLLAASILPSWLKSSYCALLSNCMTAFRTAPTETLASLAM